MKTELTDNMDQDHIQQLIANNLAGNATDEDVLLLERWIKVSPLNKKYYQQVENIWEASDRKFESSGISTEEALKSVMERIEEVPASLRFWHYWQKIAAVLLIPLLISGLLWGRFNKKETQKVTYQEVFAAYGTRTSIKLSDGSTAWLNSGSSLKYPDHFVNDERIVFLTGEAYFEVESDISKPFIVSTTSVDVKATGTKFNVQAYKNEKEVEVTLVTGKLAVSRAGIGNGKLISKLNANQHLDYNTLSGKSELTDVETYNYIAWKDGKMIFRNDPLSQVLKEIGQQYNVEFELRGENLQEYRYHATFELETLDEILKILKASSPINYVELKRELRQDGSIPKHKIIITQSKE